MTLICGCGVADHVVRLQCSVEVCNRDCVCERSVCGCKGINEERGYVGVKRGSWCQRKRREKGGLMNIIRS